jgi:hypothetical protein
MEQPGPLVSTQPDRVRGAPLFFPPIDPPGVVMPEPTKADKLRDWKETSRHKLPPISHANRVAIRRWLDRVLVSIRETLEQHTELYRESPSPGLKAQIDYFKTYRAVVSTLRAQNEQRRGYGPAK